MKKIILLFLILFIISKVHLKLTEETRRKFLSKLTTKISLENLEDLEKLESKFTNNLKNSKIEYDPKQIEDLMNLYNFPVEYNFLEDINATVRVKNQARCGCCWSHSATTALAYRYQKLGLDIDLSPQDALSCYIKDCDSGNYIIDSQLNLVKNGTVTEECLPFSSADGKTIEKCPTTCKDGSPIKKYYAQNAYMTQNYYSQSTFLDIVVIIMDQLLTNGPVVTAIDVYEDFINLHMDPERCHNEVYTYDGKSELLGGHAITIVGYGFLNGKYYWLVQNSWGEDTCDKGFVKIEFGQVGVENVAFSDPYVPEEGVTPVDLTVQFKNIDEECYLNVRTSDDHDKWENSLEVQFNNEKVSQNFNFQCGTTAVPLQARQLKCYFEWFNYFGFKGIYKFVGSNSLGIKNNFILDDSFKGKSVYYYGMDDIMPYFEGMSQYFFVSQEGSRILFFYENYGLNADEYSPIYPNEDSKNALSDCHKVQLNVEGQIKELIYCDLKKEEIEYFDDFSKQSEIPLIYYIFCGTKYSTDTFTYKLDKSKFPIFKIRSLVLPNNLNITEDDTFTVVANIEGSLDKFVDNNGMFVIFTNIENNNVNSTYLLMCAPGNPTKIGKNYNISCLLNLDKDVSLQYDNIYLLPYSLIYQYQSPYEIYLRQDIKGSTKYEPDPEELYSSFLKLSISLSLLILLLF